MHSFDNFTSTKSTIFILEKNFLIFGYPHTIFTDNVTSFTSEEFQEWCKNRGTIHLNCAPYYTATNGAAEKLIQTFEKILKKFSLLPLAALNEFLMQYRPTSLDNSYLPSKILNGRQIRTLIDVLVLSVRHIIQSILSSNNLDTDNM